MGKSQSSSPVKSISRLLSRETPLIPKYINNGSCASAAFTVLLGSVWSRVIAFICS